VQVHEEDKEEDEDKEKEFFLFNRWLYLLKRNPDPSPKLGKLNLGKVEKRIPPK